MNAMLLASLALATMPMAALAQALQDSAVWAGNVDAGADRTRRPIVFVHGLMASGETYERAALLFASNGYPATWITAYDYGTVGPSSGIGEMGPLDKFIDAVRARTGADKIDLVGHSMGSSQCRTYLGDPVRSAKVAHYAHLAGGTAENVGGVPTIVLGSRDDAIAGAGGARDGAAYAGFDKLDHIGVATASEAFAAVYAFFNGGQQPRTTAVTPQDPIAVGGYVKYSMVNTPAVGVTVDVFEVAEQTGRRTGEKPYASFTVAADSAWGPFKAKPGQHYEFCLTLPNGGKMHYYREPFPRSDLLAYFRPGIENSEGSRRIAAAIAADDSASVLQVWPLNGAVVAGRDSLKINGMEIATSGVAPAGETKNTFFVFDANHNRQSDLNRPIDSVFAGSFLTAADVYIATDTPSSVRVEYNGRALNVPNWKAKSEGRIYVLFN